MLYTLRVTRRTDEEGPGQFEATVAEFPELKGYGWSGPEAKAAVMKLAISKANKRAADAPKSDSERAFSARERGRNAAGTLDKANPKPLRPSIERPANAPGIQTARLETHASGAGSTVAPSEDSAAESNWRGGGWTRGGVLPR